MGKSEVVNEPPTWKDIAKNLQQNLLYRFGADDWDLYKKSKRNYLEKTVAYALFGPPKSLTLVDNEGIIGYEPKQIENVRNVCASIIREDVHSEDEDGDTWMSIIFVCTEIPVHKKEDLLIATVPVFRVPKKIVGHPDSVRFIDSNARVYVNWNDYLLNNPLPKCNICYPKEGIYKADINGNVILEFGQTPSCGAVQRLLTIVDQTSNVVTIGTSIITVTSLFHPLPEHLLTVTAWASGIIGIYGAIRSSATLIDRLRHNQSVGFDNQESRNCWLSLSGSAVGLVSTSAMNALQKLVKSGQQVNKIHQHTVTALSMCSVAITGLGVVNNGFVLHEKYKEKSLTALDVYQFTTSAFFFAHSAINIKTAGTIIAETQNNIMEVYQGTSKSHKHHRKFSKFKEWQSGNAIQEKSGLLSKMRMCKRREQWMKKVSDQNEGFWRTEKNVKFTESGHVEISHKLIIDPTKFFEITNDQRTVFVEASKNLVEGNLSHGQFKEIMKSINLKESISYKYQDIQNSHEIPHMWRNKRMKELKRGYQLSGDMTSLEQNIKTVADVKSTYSKDGFFKDILESNKDSLEIQCNVNLTEAGHVEINKTLSIDPMEYFRIKEPKRKLFLKVSCDLAEGKMSHRQFEKIMKHLQHGKHSSREHHKIENRAETTDTSNKNKQDTGSRQRSMLAIATIYGPANIYVIMKNFDKSLHQRLFEVAVKISELLECSPARTFFDILGSVCNYVQDLASQMERKYQEDLEKAKAEAGEDFNQQEFDRNYKIEGKRYSHFCSIILESFASDSDLLERFMTGVEEGMDLYNGLRAESASENEENSSRETDEDLPCGQEEMKGSANDSSNKNMLEYNFRRRPFHSSINHQSTSLGEASGNLRLPNGIIKYEKA
ncbi:uncharacterized protein [Anabrus simplex]|uniref:uncharacterized protein n=1 Tax=Anabrus simplex TaxID=316456 RepID=UPI0035A3863D